MTRLFVASLFLAAALIAAAPAAGPAAEAPVEATPELMGEFAADPESFFFELRYLETIACAGAILSDAAAGPELKAAASRVLGQVYAAMNATPQATKAFEQLFELDPDAELDPPAAYPRVVVRAFYSVKDSRAPVASGSEATNGLGGVYTLAVGPMDNMSPTLPGQELDMDRFAAGLTHMIVSDLMPVTSLRIVDRQRLNVLRGEIQLSSSGFADPDQAARAGRLLGAQSYLFGGVTRLPGDIVRIDLRLVKTETGEILLAAKNESRVKNGKDLLKMETKVLELLTERLDDLVEGAGAPKGSVSDEASQALRERGRASKKAMELLDLTGAAILAEDAGDIERAAGLWKQVTELGPDDALAASRVSALELELRYAEAVLPEGGH